MDQIWRWDTSVNKWAKYGYEKTKAFGGTTAWRKYDPSLGTGAAAFVDLTNSDVVMPGETFLYFRGGSETATLTLSGAVKELTASSSYSISQGHYQFVARPVPVGFKLSELDSIVTFSKITAQVSYGTAMDQIWRWDTSVNKWAKYGYEKTKAFGGTTAWRKYDPSRGTGAAAFVDLTDDDAIAADEGFLYFRGGSDTLTLTFKPYQAAE